MFRGRLRRRLTLSCLSRKLKPGHEREYGTGLEVMLFEELKALRPCPYPGGVIGPGRSEILFDQVNMMSKSFNHDTVHQTSQRASNLLVVSIGTIQQLQLKVATDNNNIQRPALLDRHLPGFSMHGVVRISSRWSNIKRRRGKALSVTIYLGM